MENPIKTIILDDEPFAVRLLKDYAEKISFLEVIYAGGDVYKVLELLKGNPSTLVFIDLQMPELSGMELMQMSNGSAHNFIITSAYQEYALDAFKYKVIDFLVKPISFQKFYESVEKFLGWQESFETDSKSKDIFIKADRKVYRINPEEILYIEGLKDYIRIHTIDDKIIVYENMKDIIMKLTTDEFLRIHRSYIIPLKRIKVIEGNRIWIADNLRLPIGETYRKSIKAMFGQ
ncbi:LytTR family DNA-binding domain-containing protein [Salegentibacter sp. LM13S]|uniref:LytR/AlgR family response regulator transcription factor n=1 Tax=Salegentibacter lacus TaxID=2873599 RepID=UPI001CCBBBF4|nr:LytTR family DNA-binding domain-containing protein [Salegentibacter lacus]MBZ9629759.1 LytTR family DNA-binding domain-containing protein [Salegentibacter lacus]